MNKSSKKRQIPLNKFFLCFLYTLTIKTPKHLQKRKRFIQQAQTGVHIFGTLHSTGAVYVLYICCMAYGIMIKALYKQKIGGSLYAVYTYECRLRGTSV
jgi:hypothetical protein